MKRKILLITIISIFSITLIGCGNTTDNNTTNNTNNNVNNTDNNKYISEAKAKDIALSDAGFKENLVSELLVELDDDYHDGKTIYEVSFKHGQEEYDYDIDATNGKILDKDQEIDD
ncbi:MAG: PepSY domain-containing protein [Bacilli bacterium]|nr:PepSY domain-containing protein [Bacilli bacterium]